MTAQLQLENEKQSVVEATFLETLFKTKPNAQAVLIWTKHNKTSKYFRSPNEATNYAVKMSAVGDVYFGVCSVSGVFANNKANKKKRATISEVVGCPALYADIDYGSGHAKGNLPPTENDAIALIARMPAEPTFIINSGNGLHAYWCFDELFLLSNDEAREFAKSLSEDWQRLLQNLAKDFGYSLDSTFDLARLLRVPETLNHKTNPPNPVTLIDRSGKTYTPQLLRDSIDGKAVTSLTKRYKYGAELANRKFVLSDKPHLDKDKWEALCDEIPLARESFNRTRKNFKDRSPSGWDLSLATYAAQAMWSDQEIVDLLLSSRIKHKNELKLHREDYYVMTITRARSTPTERTDYNSNHSIYSSTDEVYTKEDCNDLGNARRFVRQHSQFVRYCVERKKWFVYDGKRWKLDAKMEVMNRAKYTARSIAIEAANDSISEKESDLLLKHAQKTKQAKGIKDMLSMAESEPEITIQVSEFDNDKWLLNLRNGTLDLRTGQLRPHEREDYITKLIDIDYDPNAQCPTWLSFLNRIMNGNQNLISFLRRAIGYSLTGQVNERAVFVLYGKGANGKSVLTETARSLLDDYATVAPVSAIMKRQKNANTNDLAKLRSARFVAVNETDEGGRIDESAIKAMSGNEKVTARLLYSEYFDFMPEFKLWLTTNYKPTIRGTDEGIWDRLKLIPFDVRIPKEEQDKHLLEKLQNEFSGILNWAIQGCLDWRLNGLGAPPEVEQATNDYRKEQDIFTLFITQCCVLGESKWVSTASFRKEYEKFCVENGEQPYLAGNAFAEKLRTLGCMPKPMRQGRGWSGIGLLIPQ